MMRFAFLAAMLSLMLSPGAGVQAAEPWGEVDLQAAPGLHEKACVSCHVRMYGGDGSKMYTRDGRMLSNKLEVLQRVASCNATMNAGWFPEEEAVVAAWLNRHYYQFEQ